MRKRRYETRYLIGLALALVSLASAAMAQGVAPKQNGKIAFVGSRQISPPSPPDYFPIYDVGIYTMNADGTDRKQVTFQQRLCPPPNRPPGTCGPDQEDFGPVWSPDGKQIAFVRGVPMYLSNLHSEIFVMNADGSNQQQLTQSLFVDLGSRPTWSPDGAKIAFAGNSKVYVMNADGSGATVISYTNSYQNNSPAWSPDGSRLAVARYNGIYLINIDGSNGTQITQAQDEGPTWSPDGSKIAFTRWTDCFIGDCQSAIVWTVNSDGSNSTKLADIQSYDPSWSPDGTKIIFSTFDGGLFTIKADGSDITNITNTADIGEYSASWQAVSTEPADVNPIDNEQFFVRQHYLDFLNREPDPGGLAFWMNSITACGTDQSCIDAARVNVSGAFYLSIEFQQTGYLVYRYYKASYGNAPGAPVPLRLNEFLPDTKEIGQGVVVNQSGWEQVLESNKQAFATAFVQRSRFVSAYPTSMSSEQFVDALFANAGVIPSASDRTAAINEFSFTATTNDVAARARALRRVAENSTFQQQEFNRAFVLMQYFGYLRRNPSDAPEATLDFQGYNFWLNKLNQFNGDFGGAEMVKAFLVSTEYRRRFGP